MLLHTMVQFMTCVKSYYIIVFMSFYVLYVSLELYATFYDFNVCIDHHIWLSMIFMFIVWW